MIEVLKRAITLLFIFITSRGASAVECIFASSFLQTLMKQQCRVCLDTLQGLLKLKTQQ